MTATKQEMKSTVCMEILMEKAYAMHGEQARIYLLGRYFIGLYPTKPGYEDL